jgi:hypothetical protein
MKKNLSKSSAYFINFFWKNLNRFGFKATTTNQ